MTEHEAEMIVLLAPADLEAGGGSAELADGVPVEGPRLYFAEVGGDTAPATCCGNDTTLKPPTGHPIRSPLSLNDGSGNRAQIVWMPRGHDKGPDAATIHDLQSSDSRRASGSGNSSNSSSSSSTEEGADSRTHFESSFADSSIRTQGSTASQTAVAIHNEMAAAAHLGTASAQPAAAQDTAISDAAAHFADAAPAASSHGLSNCASGWDGSAGSPSRRQAVANQALWVESRISAERFARSHTSSLCLGRGGGTIGAHAAAASATEHPAAAEAADDCVAVGRPLAVHSEEAATVTVVGWPLEGQEADAHPQALPQDQSDHLQRLQ